MEKKALGSLPKGTYFFLEGSENIYQVTGHVITSITARIQCRHASDAAETLELSQDLEVTCLSSDDYYEHQYHTSWTDPEKVKEAATQEKKYVLLVGVPLLTLFTLFMGWMLVRFSGFYHLLGVAVPLLTMFLLPGSVIVAFTRSRTSKQFWLTILFGLVLSIVGLAIEFGPLGFLFRYLLTH